MVICVYKSAFSNITGLGLWALSTTLTTDMFNLSKTLPGPFLIHDL